MSNPAVDKLIAMYARKVGPAYKCKIVVQEMEKILIGVPEGNTRGNELLGMAHDGLERNVTAIVIGLDQTDSYQSDKTEITLEDRQDTSDMAYGLLFETFNAAQCQKWVSLESSFNSPQKGFLAYGKEKANIEAVTLMHYMELVRIVKANSMNRVFPDPVSRQLKQCSGINHQNRQPTQLKCDYQELIAKTPHDSKAQQKKKKFHYLSMTSPEVAAFDACKRMSLSMASDKLDHVIKSVSRGTPAGLSQFLGEFRKEWKLRSNLDERMQLPWLWLKAGMEANYHLDLAPPLDAAKLWFTDDMCVYALRTGGKDWWYEPPGMVRGTRSEQRIVGKLDLARLKALSGKLSGTFPF